MTAIELAEKLATSPRILVVEDDENIQRLLSHCLESLGCEVVQAFNGLEAIMAMSAQQLDGVILDLRLPLKSGFEVLEWMREHDCHLPVIIATGYADEEAYRAAEMYGVLAVLAKPFTEPSMSKALQRYFTIFNVHGVSTGTNAS